jgi:hypothetical protein
MTPVDQCFLPLMNRNNGYALTYPFSRTLICLRK